MGFCPFIFQKWAGGNRCGTRVCGFSAHFPTFSLHLNAKKNKEKYIKWKIKVGFWPEDSCRSDFRHSPVKFSSIRLLPFLFFSGCVILLLRHNSIFLVTARKHLSKRCSLSFLIHIAVTEGCVAAMERNTFAGASLYCRGAPFLFCHRWRTDYERTKLGYRSL